MATSPLPSARSHGLLGAAAATAVAFSILVSLGVWQLERKTWKENLLARMTERAYGAPSPVVSEAGWPAWRASDEEYRRVRLSGRFLHEAEIRVHGLAELRKGAGAGPGYYVFTPLRLPDGSTVVVNRGFVPPGLKEASARPAGQVAGNVTVTGLVRVPEVRAPFVPENDPAADEWFVRDTAAIARARGLERAAPFYVDADATPNEGDWPRGGQTQLVLKNDHLQYAFTWFGLGASLLGVFGSFVWRRLRGGRNGPDRDGAPDPAGPSPDPGPLHGKSRSAAT